MNATVLKLSAYNETEQVWQFAWESPAENGSPITEYSIEIQGEDGAWHFLNDCNDREDVAKTR
jgi:hypothetical protein